MNKIIKRDISILLLLLIIFLSIFPRITEVVSKNYLFGFDQGRDLLVVKSILFDRHLTLIGSEWGAGSAGFIGLFHGPVYFYFLSIISLIFNGDPYGGVVLMFILSIATIIFGYFLGRKLFNQKTGLIVALLLAASPPLISSARFVWNSHPSPIFILLAFYFIFSATQKNSKLYIFLAAFFSVFIYNFQTAIALPMAASLLFYLIFILRIKNLRSYILLFLGYFLAATPFFAFEGRHGFQGIRGLFNYLFHDEKVGFTLRFIELISRDHFNSFLYDFYSTFPVQKLIPSMIILAILLCSVFYFLLNEENKHRKNFIIYLLSLPFISFFVFLLLKNAVYQYYLIELNLAYILLFGYVLYSAYRKRNTIAMIFLSGVFVVFLINAVSFSIHNFLSDYKDYGGSAKIKGKIEAIDYIYKDAAKEKFGLLIFSPPIYTYPYDYLIWWQGQKKYNYIPYKEKKGLFYLLIEKDQEKPWSYKGWMETVVKKGQILETKELPSGLIVQKRFENENK